MPTNAAERRLIYLKRKERGECPRCGIKVGKRSKYTHCENCRSFYRKYNEENAESINRTRRIQYDERKNKKCCPRCGKYLGKRYVRTLCIECLEKEYKYNYGKNRPKEIYTKHTFKKIKKK